MVNLSINHAAFTMECPKELLRLQTFLDLKSYLQWQEQWEKAHPEGFRIQYTNAESYDEEPIFLNDDFKKSVNQLLHQFSKTIRQRRIAQLNIEMGDSTDYEKYGRAMRDILSSIQHSKIMSKYAEFIDKAFTQTVITLQEKLDIDVAYNIEEATIKEVSEAYTSPKLNEKFEANLGNTSTSTSLATPPKRTRGKGKVPPGGYKSIHPNPADAVRQQFKFLDRRICRVSTLSEDEFEHFVLVTTAMIGQNTTIARIGQFAKAVNSEITYSVLTHACSDLKKTMFDKKRPDFYMISMANLFGFDPERFYKDFSEGVLTDWWKTTFPKYKIAE